MTYQELNFNRFHFRNQVTSVEGSGNIGPSECVSVSASVLSPAHSQLLNFAFSLSLVRQKYPTTKKRKLSAMTHERLTKGKIH